MINQPYYSKTFIEEFTKFYKLKENNLLSQTEYNARKFGLIEKLKINGIQQDSESFLFDILIIKESGWINQEELQIIKQNIEKKNNLAIESEMIRQNVESVKREEYENYKSNSDIEMKKNNSLIIAGYIIAFLSILILPIVFTLAGVGIGIVNISKGETTHGVLQIIIAVIAGIIGTLIGGAGFGIGR